MGMQGEFPISSELIDMYLAGRLEECSASQQEEIRRWLESSNGVASLESLIQTMSVDSPVAHHDGHGVDEQWARIEKKLDSDHVASGAVRPWLRYGVTAAMLAVVGVILFGPVAKMVQEHTSTPVYKNYSTVKGQRARVILKDGTVVMLGPATNIRYLESFGKAGRDIELDGEALFTVVRSEGLPFTVNTAGTATRVLGTVFSVRKYASDAAVLVVVAEGKVSASSTVLTTGDAAYISSTAQPIVQRGADVASELAWTTGNVRIRAMPLHQVIPELERWYNLEILADSKLMNQRVTMSLQNESPAEVISMLATLLHANAERTGNVVRLSVGS